MRRFLRGVAIGLVQRRRTIEFFACMSSWAWSSAVTYTHMRPLPDIFDVRVSRRIKRTRLLNIPEDSSTRLMLKSISSGQCAFKITVRPARFTTPLVATVQAPLGPAEPPCCQISEPRPPCLHQHLPTLGWGNGRFRRERHANAANLMHCLLACNSDWGCREFLLWYVVACFIWASLGPRPLLSSAVLYRGMLCHETLRRASVLGLCCYWRCFTRGMLGQETLRRASVLGLCGISYVKFVPCCAM